MSRVCISCKKPIPPHEDSWRDMDKRYCCKRCYQPGRPTARVVKPDDE